MSIARGFLLSAACATVGAALWAGLSHWTGYHLGIMAIIVGGLAGFGMLTGVRGRGRATAGLAAAAVTALAVVGARYAEYHVMVNDLMSEDVVVTDEEVIRVLADGVEAEWDRQGYEVTWSEEGPAAEAGYADEVWQAANVRWLSMTADAREQLRAGLVEQWRAESEAARPVFEVVGFLIGFGLFDLAWLGLGVSTAFKIGSTDGRAKAQEQTGQVVPEPEPVAGAGLWGSLGKASDGSPSQSASAGQGTREAA